MAGGKVLKIDWASTAEPRALAIRAGVGMRSAKGANSEAIEEGRWLSLVSRTLASHQHRIAKPASDSADAKPRISNQ